MNHTPNSPTPRPSILVVEDFELLRLSVVQWLQYRFPWCVVQGVESAEQALEHLRSARPDIVLMDIGLPGMSGLEATCRIKAQAPGTAVAMLTTHDTPHHRLAATQAGADGYVAKQDMERDLEPTVKSLLRSHGSART